MEEAEYVAKNLREQEVEEFDKFMDSPAFHALESLKKSSVKYALLTEEEEPIALCGIVDLPEEETKTGIVWLMTSKKVFEHVTSFYREIKNLVMTYGFTYNRLYNYVECSAKNHQVFIEALGFNIVDKALVNPDTGAKYFMFEMITPVGLNEIYNMEVN